MSMLSLRLPESLHEMARKVAKEENISINQLITLALAEKIAALKAEQFFAERAGKSDRARFERAMSRVRKVQPDEQDHLPARRARRKAS